jgi:hypothetical protein
MHKNIKEVLKKAKINKNSSPKWPVFSFDFVKGEHLWKHFCMLS